MNIFLEASRIKLRIDTTMGLLSVEQLWTLSLRNLGELAKDLNKKLQADSSTDGLDFLNETPAVNKIEQLTFDIVKEIYVIKKEEAEANKNAASIKAHNEKIDSIIFQKQENKLNELSIEELQALKK